jgi:hypothetical protein
MPLRTAQPLEESAMAALSDLAKRVADLEARPTGASVLLGIAGATGVSFSIGTAMTPISGAEFTINATGTWMLIGIFDIDAATAIGTGRLLVDGLAESGGAIVHNGATRVTAAAVWSVPLVKGQFVQLAGQATSGTMLVWSINTRLFGMRVAG